MFRYRISTSDGDDLGEATYAMHIPPEDVIHAGGGDGYRVLSIVPLDDAPIVALPEVEAA